MTRNRSKLYTIDSIYLYYTLCGKDIGLDFGQKHKAEVQRHVRLGSVHLQLFDSPAEHALNAVVITLCLRCLNLIQKNSRGDCKTINHVL